LTKPVGRLAPAGAKQPPETDGDPSKAPGAIKLAPSFEQQVAAARSLVGQDPKRAAQVVKEWVATDS